MNFVTQIIKRLEKDEYIFLQVYRWHPDNGLLRKLDTFKLYYLVKGKTKTKARSSLSEKQLE